MPAGDNTGPLGMGPRTGRGLGYCSGYNAPGFAQAIPGKGLGRGRGRGRCFGAGAGFGRGFAMRGPLQAGYAPFPAYQQVTPEQEKQLLQNEAQQLREGLKT